MFRDFYTLPELRTALNRSGEVQNSAAETVRMFKDGCQLRPSMEAPSNQPRILTNLGRVAEIEYSPEGMEFFRAEAFEYSGGPSKT